MPSPKQRVDQLRTELQRHNRLYYVDNKPEISDREYDEMLAELADLEEKHPDLSSPDSPTQRVGGEPIDAFNSVAHAVPMLSIDNTYNADELLAWGQRTFRAIDPVYRALEEQLDAVVAEQDGMKGKRGADATKQRKALAAKVDAIKEEMASCLASAEDVGYPIPSGLVAEPKVDGVAASLRYEQGQLVLAATRGDGQRGDDITHNVRAIRAVPLKLNTSKPPSVLEVRGEIYMPGSSFQKINADEQRLFEEKREKLQADIEAADDDDKRKRLEE
ncbi:MAG: hypothetical protein AAGK78_05050, partial [Planctomycetota bacterium]